MNYRVQDLARLCKVHPDTIWKAKRKRCASLKLAVKLEKATGMIRFSFMDPDNKQFPDGWLCIGKNGI